MLLVNPHFEFPDRISLRRQLDVRVHRMNVLPVGMPHERFADFLHYARFHQPAIEGVPQIMERDEWPLTTASGS